MAQVLDATKPILSPGPSSPRDKKIPYTTTKPATCAGVLRVEYSPAMRKPTSPWRPTPMARAYLGPIQSERKAPPMAPGR